MSIKIFHTSDLHLGQSFSSYSQSQELKNTRFETLDNLIEIANKKECDFFVIAGDLFNSINIPQNHITQAITSLSKFNGEAVLVLPGNHDNFDNQNVNKLWKFFLDKKTQNIVLLSYNRPYPFNAVCFYPAPCNAKTSKENNLGWIKATEKHSNSNIHIGVAHGSVEGISHDPDKKYFHMTRQELESSLPDAWLLGHTHKPYPEAQALGKIFFSGTPEPDGFDCTHRGTARTIDIDEHGTIKSEIINNTGKYFFIENENVHINNVSEIEGLIKKFTKEEYKNAFLRLNIIGALPAEHYDKKHEIRQKIENNVLHLELFDNQLTRMISKEIIKEEFTRGSFPYTLLMELENKHDNEALQIAYELIGEAKGGY